MTSHELTRTEWCALDALADDIEPVESVMQRLREEGFTLSGDEFLQVMFGLAQRGFVTVSQAPIRGFGQQFAERAISPTSPADIVGDLQHEFCETHQRVDYLQRIAITADSDPAGVPFGIYFDLTASGRAEWDKPEYNAYWTTLRRHWAHFNRSLVRLSQGLTTLPEADFDHAQKILRL